MGTKTVLDFVNAVLQRVTIIQGDAGALTSLTDSAKQNWIDTAIQIQNELIQELYDASRLAWPTEMQCEIITLGTNIREYDLPSNFEKIRWPLIFEADGKIITEYPGGFERMRIDQLDPSKFTGQPVYAVISPITGKLRINTLPTSNENGNPYTLIYDRRLSFTDATDIFPFSDTVYDALIPAASELWRSNFRKEFSSAIFNRSMGRAAGYLTQHQTKGKY